MQILSGVRVHAPNFCYPVPWLPPAFSASTDMRKILTSFRALRPSEKPTAPYIDPWAAPTADSLLPPAVTVSLQWSQAPPSFARPAALR